MVGGQPKRAARGWATLALTLLALVALLFGAPALVGAGRVSVTGTPLADSPNRAGLVVQYGDGRTTYAIVPFPEPTISGIDLLERGLLAADVPLLTVGFGGLGAGVCQIAETGCPVGDCRRRLCQGPKANDPYWRYFRQVAPGTWRALPLGGSATKVGDGDLDAWSWTGTEAGLPALSLEKVATLAGATGGDATVVGRTVGPTDLASTATRTDPTWGTYAGAGGILAIIGAGAVMAARRRAPPLAP